MVVGVQRSIMLRVHGIGTYSTTTAVFAEATVIKEMGILLFCKIPRIFMKKRICVHLNKYSELIRKTHLAINHCLAHTKRQ